MKNNYTTILLLGANMKKKWLIPLIIGIIIGTIGIVLIIVGVSKQVPDMGDGGWFNAKTSKTTLIFLGGAAAFVGYVILSIFVTFSVYATSAEGEAKMILNSKKHMDSVNNILKNNMSEDEYQNLMKQEPQTVKQKKYYCKYCGCELNEEDKYCTGCGAKRTRTK